MTPSKKGWLLTGTREDMGVIRLHLPAHYMLTPHATVGEEAQTTKKASPVAAPKTSSSDAKVTVSASIKRRPQIQKAALAGGITIIDTDVAPHSQALRALPPTKLKKTERVSGSRSATSTSGSDGGGGRGGGGGGGGGSTDDKSPGTSSLSKGDGSGGRRKVIAAKKRRESESSLHVDSDGDTASVKEVVQHVTNTLPSEADENVEMRNDSVDDVASATTTDADECKDGVPAEAEVEAEGDRDDVTWVRRARRLKIRRVWLMLEFAGIGVDAKTRQDVGDDRKLMKARFTTILESATSSQVQRMQTWIRDYRNDKRQCKAQCAAK